MTPARRIATIVVAFAAVKLTLHLLVGAGWGFQRDELLYLAQARHLDWGFWSTPPFTGFVAWLVLQVSTGGPATLHFAAMLASTLMLVLVGLIARDMGGKAWAVVIACLAMLVSPGFVRTGALFQPVVFDVLFWTLGVWLIVRYIRTGEDKWVWLLGPVVGLGMLTKYSMAFFVLGAVLSALAAPQRRVLRTRAFWGAVAIATAIALPNVLWQQAHGYPVVTHVRDLAVTQLGNVTSAGFMLDQVLTYLPALPVWVAGLVWLFTPAGRRFRMLGWLYLAILFLMLLLSGKSYYTMGAYPVLMAAGGVALERMAALWRGAVVLFAAAVGLLLSPYSLPYLSPPDMVAFGRWTVESIGTDAPMRWEDGRAYPLPQDYADMLGWERIGELAERAVAQGGDADGTIIYAENYGQAGAVEHYTGRVAVSFNDAYRLWAPDSLPPDFSTLVYVGSRPGADVDSLFADIRVVGSVTDSLAREFGTTVWLCRAALPGFADHYARRAAEVRASGGR